MILSSHIIVAAVVTAPLAISTPLTPVSAGLIFLIALASHYALDMIPHWAYKLSSVKNHGSNEAEIRTNKKLILKDLGKMTIDGLLGLGIVFWLLWPIFGLEQIIFVLIITVGALLPDFLEGLYFIFKKPPFVYFHKLHSFFHTNYRIQNKAFKGASIQVLTIALIVILFI